MLRGLEVIFYIVGVLVFSFISFIVGFVWIILGRGFVRILVVSVFSW